MVELTDRMLQIPFVVAAKYAKRGTWRFDELVSEGNLGLVRAAASYREGAGSSLSTWLMEGVKWSIKRLITKEGEQASKPGENPVVYQERRWKTMVSLETPLEGREGEVLGHSISATSEPDELESRDDVNWVLSGLYPLDRAIYVLYHARNLSRSQIMTITGLTEWEFRNRMAKMQKYVRRRAAAMSRRRGRGNLKAVQPPQSDAQKEAAARFCRERAAAERLLGRIPAGKGCLYLASDASKSLRGPSESLAGLMPLAGLAKRELRGGKGGAARAAEELLALGWRVVRGPEARRMAEYEGYRLADLPSMEVVNAKRAEDSSHRDTPGRADAPAGNGGSSRAGEG